ncbi:heme-dependent oxidative N-demethylase family protein [Sutcliffiella rhizosphaerae]|uniref:DUF3445 domain-containing protein n=1 Tax=Sutcliffiella rhizosphaerae TaxID=2880967 RepID=A0ABM8YJI0_9BACI|nr:DUF3445 domain-containing protein [Sutcliffiella rhizosphaerae]CAG9620014.1 hypothetical protein BACCIP111883_00782 [Sutcliffiella rhizosphaerae]
MEFFEKEVLELNDTEEIKGFPYPFTSDNYRYSNNSKSLNPPVCVDISNHYKKQIALKRALLTEHFTRCFHAFPHTKQAQWEALELIMEHLSSYFPNHFILHKTGDNWTFRNMLLGEESTFTFGEDIEHPLDFIGRHVQEDLILMLQKDNDLFLDAGQLCFPANWSLAFNHGMNFKEIHFPIPGFNEEGLDDRILRFLLKLEAGSPWGRKNWSLMAGNRLDASLETFVDWGIVRGEVTAENAGKLVHLRVEVQKLFRLPGSNAILFTIHTHLLSLEKLVANPTWCHQFYQILQELPPHIVEYKGISLYQDSVLAYLKKESEKFV